MPPITVRLYKARYGEYGFRLPARSELDKTVPTLTDKERKRYKPEQYINKLMDTMLNPPKKDIYYKYHKQLVSDYLVLNQQKAKFRLVTSVARRIAYFNLNPHLYDNNYSHYAILIVSHILFSMRKTILRQMITDKKIPVLYDFNNPASNGYYPLPKPMTNPVNIKLGNHIYDILSPLVDSIMARNR